MQVLLPIKAHEFAKQRLADLFDATQRACLVEAMARDVLIAAKGLPALAGQIAILGSDGMAARIANECQVQFVSEPGSLGLNGALDFARQGDSAKRPTQLLIMHADLPLADTKSIGELLEVHADYPADELVSLVPDRSGRGSNCLVMTPANSLPMLFGDNSRQRFQSAAKGSNMPCQLVELPNLQFDIDEPQDVFDLMARIEADSNPVALHTARLLRTESMLRRLEQYVSAQNSKESVRR